MRGFAPQALILLPAQDKYEEAYGGYKTQFAQAIHKLLSYLHSIDMEPCFLMTDPVAYTVFGEEPGVNWIATENQGGIYFLRNNCALPTVAPLSQIPQQVLEELDKKFPVERGSTVEQRWYVESKRVNLAEKLIIARHTVVFLFGNQYRLTPKQNDGRALFFINQQFIPRLKLSGNDANITMFLGIENANMSITEWRVPDGGKESTKAHGVD